MSDKTTPNGVPSYEDLTLVGRQVERRKEVWKKGNKVLGQNLQTIQKSVYEDRNGERYVRFSYIDKDAPRLSQNQNQGQVANSQAKQGQSDNAQGNQGGGAASNPK
jgi:hypothetical protein